MTKATTYVERSYRQSARRWCTLDAWSDAGECGFRAGEYYHPLGIITIHQWATAKTGPGMVMTLIDRDGYVWNRWWDDAPSRAACARRARAFIEERCGA